MKLGNFEKRDLLSIDQNLKMFVLNYQEGFPSYSEYGFDTRTNTFPLFLVTKKMLPAKSQILKTMEIKLFEVHSIVGTRFIDDVSDKRLSNFPKFHNVI